MGVKNMILSERFQKAVSLACDLHRNQKRKNLPTPFIAHPLSVAALVIENIEQIESNPMLAEDYAIAAVLHDTIEDQGGMLTYEIIEKLFGKNIADIVLLLSDSAAAKGETKPPKATRNRIYRQKMESAPLGVVLISCCDKLHNLRSMKADYDIFGTDIWNAYSQSPALTLENYRTLEALYSRRLGSHRILSALHDAICDVERILPKNPSL